MTTRYLPAWPPPQHPREDDPTWTISLDDPQHRRVLTHITGDLILLIAPIGNDWVVTDEWEQVLAITPTAERAVDAAERIARHWQTPQPPNPAEPSQALTALREGSIAGADG